MIGGNFMDEGTRRLIEEIDNRLSNRYMVYEQVGNSLTVKERENGKLKSKTLSFNFPFPIFNSEVF